MSDSARDTFLHNLVFSMTLTATVQRGKVYSDGATEVDRTAFQKALRSALERIAATYSTSTTEATHEANIVELANSLSVANGPALRGDRFRIGSAQKALNLFLKFRWCMGQGPEPPHCPFDRRIIMKFSLSARRNWTALDSIDDYRELVTAARTAAAGRSLADWELEEYNAV